MGVATSLRSLSADRVTKRMEEDEETRSERSDNTVLRRDDLNTREKEGVRRCEGRVRLTRCHWFGVLEGSTAVCTTEEYNSWKKMESVVEEE